MSNVAIWVVASVAAAIGACAQSFASEARRKRQVLVSSVSFGLAAGAWVWCAWAIFSLWGSLPAGVAGGTSGTDYTALMIAVVGLVLTGLTGISVAYVNRAMSDVSSVKEQLEAQLQLDARLRATSASIELATVSSISNMAHMEALNEIGAARQAGVYDLQARIRAARLNEVIDLFSTSDRSDACRLLSVISRDPRIAAVIGPSGWRYIFSIERAFPKDDEIEKLAVKVKALAPPDQFARLQPSRVDLTPI